MRCADHRLIDLVPGYSDYFCDLGRAGSSPQNSLLRLSTQAARGHKVPAL
jgi:hypothetical protein